MSELVRRFQPFIGQVRRESWAFLRYDSQAPQWAVACYFFFCIGWYATALGIAGILTQVNIPLTRLHFGVCAGIALVLIAPLAADRQVLSRRAETALTVFDLAIFLYGLMISIGQIRLEWSC